MAVTPNKRTRLSPEARQEQLISIALELIKSMPLESVTADVVGEHAGVSKALVFHYFSTNRELHLAACQEGARELAELLASASDRQDSAERLLAGINSFIDYIAAQPATFSALSAFAANDADFGEVFNSVRQLAVDLIREVAEADTALLFGWVAMVEQATLRWLTEPTITQDDLVAHLMVSLGALLHFDDTAPRLIELFESQVAR